MIDYFFDVYPRADPVGGAKVGRLSGLLEASYRGEANGTGAGKAAMRATGAAAALLNPDGLDLIRVVRSDGATEKIVGGWWTENFTYQVINRKRTKRLTVEGAGMLAYFARARMANQSYLTVPFIGQHPFDDKWRLWAAGTGHTLGAIWWRVVRELQEAGRPRNPIPGVTMTFDYTTDSNGVPWSKDAGQFEAQVGESVLQVLKRLMELGLYVELDPETFELNAYEPGTHSRDRTGGAWGASVVRLQVSGAGTVADGNILNESERGIAALVKRSDILVGANDVYEWVAAVPAPDIVWEGYKRLEDDSGDAFADVGAAELDARSDAAEPGRIRLKTPANDPTHGIYLPFETSGVMPDDRVTVHSGAGTFDWDESTQRVQALTIGKRRGGDWQLFADLGTRYSSISDERAFAATPVGPHSHPPNPRLCDLCVEGSGATTIYDADIVNDCLAGGVYTNPAFAGDPVPRRGKVGSPGATYTGCGALQHNLFNGLLTAGQTYTITGIFSYLYSTGASTKHTIQFKDAAEVTVGSFDLFLGAHGAKSVWTASVSFTVPAGGYDHIHWLWPTFWPGSYSSLIITQESLPVVNSPDCVDPTYAGTSNRAARCDHNHDDRYAGLDHTHHRIIDTLINNSGADVTKGDVVVADQTTDGAFTTTTTAGYTDGPIMIVQEDIAAGDPGSVLIFGTSEIVNLGGAAPTRGDFLFTGTNAGEATTAGTRGAGSFGQVVVDDADVDASPGAVIWGVPDQSVLSNPMNAVGDVIRGGASGAPTRLGIGATGEELTVRSGVPAWEAKYASLSVIIDGGGSAIATGEKGHVRVPYACEIVRASLLADQSGSIVIDIWKDTYANFPPTVADTITASAKPTLSSAQKAEDTTLTGWTTTLAEGDVLGINVDSATTVQRVTLELRVKRT